MGREYKQVKVKYLDHSVTVVKDWDCEECGEIDVLVPLHGHPALAYGCVNCDSRAVKNYEDWGIDRY